MMTVPISMPAASSSEAADLSVPENTEGNTGAITNKLNLKVYSVWKNGRSSDNSYIVQVFDSLELQLRLLQRDVNTSSPCAAREGGQAL